MKVKVENRWGHTRVSLTQGNQQFFLDYEGTKTDCLWYARMFRIALKNHDAERMARVTGLVKPPTRHSR